MNTLIAFAVSALLAAPAAAAVRTEAVEYAHEGKAYQGYFAWDDAVKGRRPAVMVVHEWWGHGPYVRRRAEELAALGYLAFAGDMYGKGLYAKTHEEAGKLAGAARKDRALMRRLAQAGVDRMKAHPLADPARLAAMGYCFGGAAVLELARAGADLQGVVSFHGGLDAPEPAEPGRIKAKVLALHGAEDAHVNPALPGFMEEMRRAKADWQLVVYSGAGHGFTVREGPAYDEAADRRSWRAMQAFFDEIFRRP